MGSFEPVRLEDKERVSRYLRLFPRNEASEYTFTNLFIWGGAEHIEWTEGDGYMLIRTCPGSEARYLMAFAPEDKLPAALEDAVVSAAADGAAFSMHSLPGWYCDMLREHIPERFVFEHERHLDDYVYNAEDLIGLAGRKYHGKRNHINRFISAYGGRYAYAPFDPNMAGACMDVYERWLAAQSDPAALNGELDSVRRALWHSEELGIEGGVILVDGVPEAFSLGERLTEDMAVIHIEKANPGIPELFTLINRDFAANAFSGMRWINREEDMGYEGLMKAKQSYRPARMVEKYRAVLAI